MASIDEIKKNSHQMITMTLIQTIYPNHTTLCAGKQEAHSVVLGVLAQCLSLSSVAGFSKLVERQLNDQCPSLVVHWCNQVRGVDLVASPYSESYVD